VKKSKIAKVAKRDGSHETFELGKLRRALANAMRGCGYDQMYADALAKAVAIHVKEWGDTTPPSTEYIFGCVRAVLDETGLGDVAAALQRHFRQRETKRRAVEVLTTRHADQSRTAWSKGRVATTLERRHGIKPSVARILAGEIESRVLGLNYSLVSSALIAELIRNELMAWGLSDDAIAVALRQGVDVSVVPDSADE
jgi:transcriptional regulator NrdR family protein